MKLRDSCCIRSSAVSEALFCHCYNAGFGVGSELG